LLFLFPVLWLFVTFNDKSVVNFIELFDSFKILSPKFSAI